MAIIMGIMLISGCTQENPLLYDPSMRDSSVSVRFVNMSIDGQPKSFMIDGCSEFSNILYGTSSELKYNTIDSAHYSLLSNDIPLLSTKSLKYQKLSFFRNTIQTFVSINVKDTAKIIQISTFRTDAVKGKALIRVVNTCSDSTEYNVYLGCEQGEVLAESLKNGAISQDKQVSPGLNAITITRASDNMIIGTFDNVSSVFSSDSIYTMFIGIDKTSLKTRLWVLNELCTDPSKQLFEFLPSNTLQSGIVVYNLSLSPIDASYIQGNQPIQLAKGLQSITSDSSILSVCNIQGSQKITITDPTGKTLAEEEISVSPYKTYSCIFSQNKYSLNGYSLYILEQNTISTLKDISYIKAISSGFDQAITINSAARTYDNILESGRILFESVSNGFVTKDIAYHSGPCPLLIQTSSSPQKVLNQFIGNLGEGTTYILIALPERLLCINEKTRDIQVFEEGVISQIMHAGSNSLKPIVSVGNTITNAKLQTDGILTTVIPLLRSTVVNSKVNSITITPSDKSIRYCYMIDESESILDYSYNSSQLDSKLTKIRIVNLSPGTDADLYLDYDKKLYDIIDTNKVKVIEIRNSNRDFYSQIRGITYKQSSNYITIDRERRLSFSVLKWQDPPLIYASLNNVLISLGKNYSIILVPELNGTHRTIIRQEY
ncbi:hypothetical protein EBV26_09420 [bacterium]|nr:hypothetical protein [bacterium]